jgi:hypothetical protein
VWKRVLILITQNTTNYYIYYTNYYKLTSTITKYFLIYLHPEVIVIIAAIRVVAYVTGRCFEGEWLQQRRGGATVITEDSATIALRQQLLLGGVELVHRRFL